MTNSVGKIVSINKDLYTVRENNNVFSLSVRGKLKNTKLTVGDNVEFNKETKTIENVLERKNTLERPLISNIDKLFIVCSNKVPAFSTYLLDKFLVLTEVNNIKPIIIITKMDLLNYKEKKELKNTLSYYEKLGYKVYKNTDVHKIKKEMKNNVVAVSGQTGAGKSTLLNIIDKNLHLETGEVSKALGRGKHTTRLVSLIYTNKSLIADTPGFSALDLKLTKEEIKRGFIEFNKNCKYKSCCHTKEEGCEVIKLVENKKILQSRYDSYIKLISEAKDESKW